MLARHGKVNVAGGWIAPWEIAEWIERYNHADIFRGPVPSDATIKAQSAGRIVSSTLVRATESAQLLAPKQSILTDEVFREAGLPYSLWRAPQLPAPIWAATFRLAWFRGFSAHAESHAQAKLRARIAAQKLITLARESESVFLVGHGIMNALIAAELKSLGLHGPARPQTKYWQFSSYRLKGTVKSTNPQPA